jgi:hypothetical protein
MMMASMKYRKAVNMVAQINPELERMRAQSILRSFTEYKEAVDLFAPASTEVESAEPARRHGRSIMRVINAIRLNRRHVVGKSVQQPVYSPRPAITPSDCAR